MSGFSGLSNYPPGVTGSEPQIQGAAEWTTSRFCEPCGKTLPHDCSSWGESITVTCCRCGATDEEFYDGECDDPDTLYDREEDRGFVYAYGFDGECD